MRKLGFFLAVLLYPIFGFSQVELIEYKQLEQKIKNPNKLTLVNFWATWCGPCIKELPYFQEASQRDDVNILLVSLDFPNQLDKVQKFVVKKNLSGNLYLLNETDYDSYMQKVSENWSGAIPATLVIDTYGDRYFYESSFSKESLNQTIEKHLN